MPDFKAAIFDLDGTLIDSLWVWEKIDTDFLAKRRLTVPDNYIKEINSKSFKEAAEYTVALFGLKESSEEIIDEWNRMALDMYSHHVPLKPHAQEYLLFLKERGVKLGIATALPQALYEPVLRNNGIYALFDAFASTVEVGCGKECPAVYLLAAQRLKAPPDSCIAFEDVLAGIKGIIAAGMKAYGVYDKYAEHEQALIKELAEAYIYDFAELM